MTGEIMNSAIQLTRNIFAMKFPWNVWVQILILVNMGGGLYFIQTLEGKITLACLMGSFVVMTIIYSQKGFVRLLGMGHVLFWTPLVFWMGKGLDSGSLENPFRLWILSLVTVNSISLIIDYVDVIRYWGGDRDPL